MKSKYNPDMCAVFVRLSQAGLSEQEIAAHFMVNLSTIQRWETSYEEFRDAKALGKVMREAHYFKMGRDACISNDPFREGLFKYLTGVMFNWSEKHEVTDVKAPKTEEELDQRIKDLEAKLKVDSDDNSSGS